MESKELYSVNGGEFFKKKTWNCSIDEADSFEMLKTYDNHYFGNFRDVGFQMCKTVEGNGDFGSCYDWERIESVILGNKKEVILGMSKIALAKSVVFEYTESLSKFNSVDMDSLQKLCKIFYTKVLEDKSENIAHDVIKNYLKSGVVKLGDFAFIEYDMNYMILHYKEHNYDISEIMSVRSPKDMWKMLYPIIAYKMDFSTLIDFIRCYEDQRVLWDIHKKFETIIK